MLEEKMIESKLIYDGRVVKLYLEKVLLPNGEVATREVVKTSDSVGVIAITKDNKIVYISQYRKTMNMEFFESPAGRIDEGEEPLQAARRELLEETGYGNGDFKLINTFTAGPGTNRSNHYMFLATDVELISSKQDLDEDEFVIVHVKDFAEFENDINNSQVQDLKTAYACQYLKNYYARWL